jgi:hypothetical protein
MSENNKRNSQQEDQDRDVIIESRLEYPLTVARNLREANGKLASKRMVSIVPKGMLIEGLRKGQTKMPLSVWNEIKEAPSLIARVANKDIYMVTE